MLKDIYIALRDRCAGLPGIKHAGAYEEGIAAMENALAVALPAVLIEFLPASTQTTRVHKQKATITVNIHLLTAAKSDARIGSPNTDRALARLGMADDLHKLLQGYNVELPSGLWLNSLTRLSFSEQFYGIVIDTTQQYTFTAFHR